LKPYPTEHLHCHPVSPKVNRPEFDTPECIAPL
jgi:putative SOS response-associated peptidase YedK